ncbi:MAG: MarR family winged helix-turn-helix transcriptional regulator [Spirochaetota bacterium]
MKTTMYRRPRRGGCSDGSRRRTRAAAPRAHLHRDRASRSIANELELITATCPGYNLGKAYKYVTREFEKEFRESNLSLAQFALLVNIGRKEPASGSDVASRLGSDVSTVSRTIDLLVKRGLVLQKRGEDRRVRVYCLTDDGHAALDEAIPKWRRAKRATLAGLDRSAWNTTLRQIQKLGA